MNRSLSLGFDYFDGYSNQSLKKYVAKKTVYEQAFRNSDNFVTGNSGVADIKSTIGSTISGGGGGSGLFAKADGATESKGGLFAKTDSAGESKSGLFSNNTIAKGGDDALSKAIAEKKQEQSAPAAEGEKKSSLFSNTITVADKKEPQKDTSQSTVSKSLFGDSKAASSLFGPSNEIPKDEPKLNKIDSTIGVFNLYRLFFLIIF